MEELLLQMKKHMPCCGALKAWALSTGKHRHAGCCVSGAGKDYRLNPPAFSTGGPWKRHCEKPPDRRREQKDRLPPAAGRCSLGNLRRDFVPGTADAHCLRTAGLLREADRLTGRPFFSAAEHWRQSFLPGRQACFGEEALGYRAARVCRLQLPAGAFRRLCS